jgi:hypothetical protein
MENSLVRQQQHATPAFVENAMQSIDNMMKYADTLLASGLCPAHLYEKGPDNKPDLKRGKPAAVVMVLQHGMEVGLSPMQALQQVIPVNGLVSIKGDGAKSLIFGSGVLEKGSWVEKETGTIKDENYTFSITAKRKDNGMQLTRTFSVDDAKRAGLWITNENLKGKDGWKYKKSAWFKYPDRMVRYRCLGFIARDLFSDVLAGMYTAEEAQDLPQDTEVIISTPSGATITVPDQEFDKDRSKALTSKAADLIDKKNKAEDLVEQPASPKETTATPPEPEQEEKKEYRLEELNRMKNPELLEIIQTSEKMKTAVKVSPRKNTSLKFREIIMGFQKGTLDKWIDDELKSVSSKGAEEKKEEKKEEPQTGELKLEAMGDEEEGVEDAHVVEEEQSGEIAPNNNFDTEKSTEESEEDVDENKFEIDVTEVDLNGRRGFDDLSRLYQEMDNIAGVNGRVYDTVISEKFPELGKEFKDKEDFCSRAPKSVINKFLNSIEKD